MSSGISGTGGQGVPISNYTNTDIQVTTTKVVENVWTDDSIKELFSPEKKESYNQYPGFPSVSKPDFQLANQFDISAHLKDYVNREMPPMDLTLKNPSETTLNRAYDGFFEKIIADKPNADELRFAHYNAAPGTPPTTPEELEAFKLLLNQFPEMNLSNFVPKPDTAFYQEQVNLAYGDEFSNLLDNQVPPLTADQKALLKFMHFHPNAKFEGSDNPKLLAQLKSLEGEASAIIAKNFNIPLNADGTPKMNLSSDSSMYDAGLNGYFDEYANQAATAYVKSLSLSEADIKQLNAYIKDPSTPVSDAIKTAGDMIRSQAIAKVNKEFHLEAVGFVPAEPGTFAPIPSHAIRMLNEAEATFNTGAALVALMPNGPQKAILLDILRQISRALSDYKSALYQGQGATTAQAANYSKAKLDIALEQIKKNVDAMRANVKGPETCGDVVGRIFKFLAALLLMSFAAGLGPMGAPLMAIAVMLMIDAVAPKFQVFTKVMEGIAMLVAKSMPYLQGEALKAFQMIAKMLFIMMAGPALLIALPDLLTASNIIADLAIASGKSKEDAQQIQQIASMVIGAIITVVVMVATLVVTFGAGLPGVIGQFIKGVGSVASQLSALLPKMAAIAMDVVELATAGFMIIDNSFKINNAVIKMNLIKLMAKVKAAQALSDAEIQMMVKMIKKLLASLQGSSEAISFISGIQSHILSNQSQAISGITNVQG